MTDEITLELCAQQFEFIAKLLRGSRTVRRVENLRPVGKPIPSWEVAAKEAEIAAEKIRADLSRAR